MKRKWYLMCLAFMMLTSFVQVQAQQARVRQSPKQTVSGKVGNATITITYGSPSVKGRKIWGDLVPFGKVWRAGANEATQIETDADLLVEGKKLPAGKFTIYTIPNENQWQIIFNSQVGQWGIERSGETTRNPEKDVLVVSVKPLPANTSQESLVYTITENGISLLWEALVIPINIK
jgi:hypothetical protein